MFCPGWQKWHGIFVRGGKLMRNVLSGMLKNDMGFLSWDVLSYILSGEFV